MRLLNYKQSFPIKFQINSAKNKQLLKSKNVPNVIIQIEGWVCVLTLKYYYSQNNELKGNYGCTIRFLKNHELSIHNITHLIKIQSEPKRIIINKLIEIDIVDENKNNAIIVQ